LKKYHLEYKSFGSNAVLIEWPQQIDKNILKDIQNFLSSIETNLAEVVIECIPAYASVTIIYKNITFKDLVEKLRAVYKNSPAIEKVINYSWQLPVCYHQSLGFDLQNYCTSIRLPIEKIIQIHTQTIYTIYFIGFLPGFLYLGNLDERLFLDRKGKPKLKVPKGAVGIGGQQTGIYPQSSPGGWHIIGNCPVELFNANRNPPSVFKAGDKIQFYQIGLEDFEQGNFEVIKKQLYA